MLSNLLSTVICQSKNPEPKAMLVSFSMPIDHDTEEGYGYLDVALFAEMNYVGVYTRERWTVIPLEDLEDGSDGDTYVKKGKSYNEGNSGWKLISYHDSCWRDAVRSTIFENRDNFNTFTGPIGSFYSLIDPAELPKER